MARYGGSERVFAWGRARTTPGAEESIHGPLCRPVERGNTLLGRARAASGLIRASKPNPRRHPCGPLTKITHGLELDDDVWRPKAPDIIETRTYVMYIGGEYYGQASTRTPQPCR
jgi:hypothetical protein